MNTGKKIRNILTNYRKLNRLTQEGAAEKFNISTEYYGKIERGICIPSYPCMLRICEKTGCEFSDFFELSDTVSNINREQLHRIREIEKALSESTELTNVIYQIVIMCRNQQ